MILLPTLPTPPVSSPMPPILLPERSPSGLAPAAINVAPVPLGSTFSTTFEFVFTPNHQHDGINE